MRGFPLLQTVLVVLAAALAGVPVYRLTRPAAAVASVAPSAVPSAEDTPAAAAPAAAFDVEAVFVPAPTDFQIKNVGATVLAGRGPKARFTGRWTGSVPPDGADLVVEVRWPVSTGDEAGAGLAAARVTVRFPDGRQVEKSFWANANGTLADVLTLPAATPPTQETP